MGIIAIGDPVFNLHVRPSELLDLYEPYWTALSNEFQRRRNESSPSEA